MLERYFNRDTVLLVGANLVPLLGALIAGWDPLLLVLFYWLETAVIGFWVCLRVATQPADPLLASMAGSAQSMNGIGLALFMVVHAGIFMGVHLFMLLGFFGGDWRSQGIDFDNFIGDVVIGKGLWLPLLGIVLIRGLMSYADTKAGRGTGHLVIGFYLRIIVMQFTILLGGWVMLALLPFGTDMPIAALLVLATIKTLVELQIIPIIGKVQHAIEEGAARRDRPAP
jgi:hypothetical protein